MNRTPETIHQTNVTGERAEIERGLRLAKKYWLKTIQSHVKGRILRGVEFFVARHAHWRLQEAIKKAGDWNRLCAEKTDGVHLPVSVDVDLSAENFREPEVPEMLFAENVKPEVLAAVAAPLVNKGENRKAMTPDEAIHNAHELLMAAERYIGTLPEKKDEIDSWHSDFDTAFSTITFAEIKASNKNDSGRLPLLLPIGQKKKGRTEQEVRDNPLSVTAIKAAVKLFLDERTPRMSQTEYEREQEQQDRLAKTGMLIQLGSGKPMSYQEWQQSNQDGIDDCLKNNRISLQDLCTMRWERFKKNSRDQQNRAIAREAKKTGDKPKAPKTKLPKSAASSPLAAGKRQK
jgi:hypothetical protein